MNECTLNLNYTLRIFLTINSNLDVMMTKLRKEEKETCYITC